MAEYEEKCGGNEGAEVPLLPSTTVFYLGDRFLCIYDRYMELYFEISDFAGFSCSTLSFYLSIALQGFCTDLGLS